LGKWTGLFDDTSALSRASLTDGTIVCDGFRVERSVRLEAGDETYRVVGPKGEPGLLHVLFLRVRDRSLARWKHEITAVNRVRHPAIARTLAGGASDTGRAVIVTDPVSGESLEELRRAWGGSLPGEAAITRVCEVLEVLEAAHSRGVVHGALRPRSVYVDAERVGTHICIADFGYSRLFEESHRRGRSISETALASAAFLAPEQRGGGYVADARTDIFSAAVLALYLLGEEPLALSATEKLDEKSADARAKLVHARVLEAELPKSIANALVRALHPSRPERQAAARVLLDDLRQGLGEVSTSHHPSEPATPEDPPTIATIAELQRVLIEEARLSMGATDTGVDPLAVPRVESPFIGESRQEPPPSAVPPSVVADSSIFPAPPSSEAPASVPLPSGLFLPQGDHTKSLVTNSPGMEALRGVPSPLGSVAPTSLPVAPTETPSAAPRSTPGITHGSGSQRVPAVSVGSGRSERPPTEGSRAEREREHVGGLLAGRYVLDRPLASGGMATVYLGCLVGGGGMARTVAIKRVHPSLAVDARCTAMMLDEARMASRISHPNVVPILDVIREADEIMLVLEYVHGVTASQLAKEGASQTAIPPAIATAILVGALRGLDAAHAATDSSGRPLGLVHRDVSPQNIMIGLDGAARVIDFGIARALGRAEVTTGTELRGKVAYMAPERLRGQKTDLRVDLWSAGVVLWELVSGTKLFQADDPIEVAVRVCTGAIPQTGHDALDAVLERALARDLEERFRTAAEMADALAAALPPASPAEVAAYLKQGCGRLLDAQSMALASLKNRIEKGVLPDPLPARLRTPMGFVPPPPSPPRPLDEQLSASPAPDPEPEPSQGPVRPEPLPESPGPDGGPAAGHGSEPTPKSEPNPSAPRVEPAPALELELESIPPKAVPPDTSPIVVLRVADPPAPTNTVGPFLAVLGVLFLVAGVLALLLYLL